MGSYIMHCGVTSWMLVVVLPSMICSESLNEQVPGVGIGGARSQQERPGPKPRHGKACTKGISLVRHSTGRSPTITIMIIPPRLALSIDRILYTYTGLAARNLTTVLSQDGFLKSAECL
ncbi:hypothetical protein ARMGADRAFT_571685 [Armillaria gallica]|uniref:Secreted protein n=1 Tax=Armillaria gallica TaxID=47427 RepID=A0A2H3DSP3_ARMGA|nr:hypothetical protein ARMGADRAFT_571685 [Armillaria gallica]